MYTVNIGRVVISIRERDALRADFFVYRYRKGTEESSQMREEIYQIRHPEHILFTARYHIEVDGQEQDILTGADGWWGSFTEFYRMDGDRKISDAAILSIYVPDAADFSWMRQNARYLFGELQPIEKNKKRSNREAR